MSAIAIRLSIAGSAVVLQKVNVNFSVKTDEQFLHSMCHAHKYDVEYFAIDKFDVCNVDRFENDTEQTIVHTAFTALWELAHSNRVNKITATIYGDAYYENIEHFLVLYRYCSGFDIFEKGRD